MSRAPLHLFLEIAILGGFVATGLWTRRRFGRDGVWLYGALAVLGATRENFVALERWLYGFADLRFRLGAAPLVAAVIWSFAIASAIAAAEALGRRRFDPARPPRGGELGWVALFLVALAGFFEPFLELVGMARWESGTVRYLGVPLIALVGYPTLAVAALATTGAVLSRTRSPERRLVALLLTLVPLAAAHAWGLARLKSALGW